MSEIVCHAVPLPTSTWEAVLFCPLIEEESEGQRGGATLKTWACLAGFEPGSCGNRPPVLAHFSGGETYGGLGNGQSRKLGGLTQLSGWRLCGHRELDSEALPALNHV